MKRKEAYQAILESKCPKCRQGDMFLFPLNKITKFAKMHQHCGVCGLRFEVEPGFFFGAMYISYAFTVSIIILTGVILWLFELSNMLLFILSVFTTVIVLLPFIFRFSRVLFLHLFGGVKYDSKWTVE